MNIFFENKSKDYLKFRGKSSFLHSWRNDIMNRYSDDYYITKNSIYITYGSKFVTDEIGFLERSNETTINEILQYIDYRLYVQKLIYQLTVHFIQMHL